MGAAIGAWTLAWGVASFTRPGESESGDTWLVEKFEGGVLAAVIDAVGHGAEAARTAELAARTLARHARDRPDPLMRLCHAHLRFTRGAAISFARFDWEQECMTWLGVGSVAGVLIGKEPDGAARVKPLLVKGGTIGDRLPELHASVAALKPKDRLILATDGIRSNFADSVTPPAAPQQLANRILEKHATRRDDALVLVLDCNAGA